jgi:hypothetical protein
LVNVAAYVYSAPHTHTHTHTHTPNQELHTRPHLPIFYHNNTLRHFILSFNNSQLQPTQL